MAFHKGPSWVLFILFVLFIFHAADVIKLVEDAGFSVHSYADDLQIYGHADPPQSTELMADCVTSVETWMASNRQRLNPAKTDVIWLGTSRGPPCTAVHY